MAAPQYSPTADLIAYQSTGLLNIEQPEQHPAITYNHMHHIRRIFTLCLLTTAMYSCNTDNGDTDVPTDIVDTASGSAVAGIDYTVVKTYPHDTLLFTEGFVVHDGQLYESTGSPGETPDARSLIGRLDLTTGKLDVKAELDKTKYFGEGIVFLNGKLYQLTYKNQQGFIYDAKTFRQTGTFTYANAEGWGLTTDGTSIIMSDGTSKLTYINPADMKPAKTISVTQDGSPLERLNELEYIRGYIYANVWTMNFIVKIDPASGKVVGVLNLNSLVYQAQHLKPDCDVLNGIAYDSVKDKIYVTGKFWPNVYEIDFPH